MNAKALITLVFAGALGAPYQGSPPDITPTMVALGDSVFHGKVGGALCYVCHGPAGKGVNGLGPSLVDKEWLHGDGSFEFVAKLVETGVPKPKKLPAPMPPKGGGQLSEPHMKAAAAYVYSLTHPQR